MNRADVTVKRERAAAASRLLAVIAGTGRQFFRSGDRVASFEVDERGRVWFLDHYTGRAVYTSYHGHWRGFSSGGTMRRLVEALRDFIRTGVTIPANHFGPWPSWLCDGDLWGYAAEGMTTVREAALSLGIVAGQSDVVVAAVGQEPER